MFKLLLPLLFDEAEHGQQDDDHEEGNHEDGQELFIGVHMAELSVVGGLLLVVLKAPYFRDEDADEDAADGHQEVGCEGVQPVVDAQGLEAACIDPGKLHTA